MNEQPMDLLTAQATVYAYDLGACAFEAIAFGRWYTERLQGHQWVRMDFGHAYYDERYRALRSEEGCRESGTAFPIVERAQAIVQAHAPGDVQ